MTVSLLLLVGCGGGGGGGGDGSPVADLAIAGVGSLDAIAAGRRLVYTFTASNAGPDSAAGVAVAHRLPAGVTPVSTSGCVESPGVATTCTLGAIAAGASAQFAVTVTVDSGTSPGTLTHAASVSSTTPDPQAANNAVAVSTAVVAPGTVIGTQQFDVRRAAGQFGESAMGNLIADAMRGKYPGVDAALINSGAIRADINCSPASAGEAACEMTWGEAFAVLPFGNRMVVETLTGAQLEQAFLDGFRTKCDVALLSGRFPQISGLKVQFGCNGTSPAIVGLWKAPSGIAGALSPIGPTDTVRIVVTDFLYAGGDGYTVLMQGTDARQTGDEVLKAVFEYAAANSPIAPVVDGRIVSP